MEGERGEPGGGAGAGFGPVNDEEGPEGLEAQGMRPLCLALVHDVRLTADGVSIVLKPWCLHPLEVVGGGIPITRH